MLSDPGARGGLDARLGASLDSRVDVGPGTVLSSDTGRRALPYGAQPNRAGVQHSPRLDAGGVLMWAHGLWRFLGHTDRALTWEGDVAVRPLKPEGDVGASDEISEGDVEGDVRSENGPIAERNLDG